MTDAALTDYRVVARLELGPRGGLTPFWAIVTGKYEKEVCSFTTKREAMDELTALVNEAYTVGPKKVMTGGADG